MMKIYKNLVAGYDYYFLTIEQDFHIDKGLIVSNPIGKWDVRFGCFYSEDLKDTERFPVVGEIDLKKLIVNAVLSAVGQC